MAILCSSSKALMRSAVALNLMAFALSGVVIAAADRVAADTVGVDRTRDYLSRDCVPGGLPRLFMAAPR
jgi:hypothetical protein